MSVASPSKSEPATEYLGTGFDWLRPRHPGVVAPSAPPCLLVKSVLLKWPPSAKHGIVPSVTQETDSSAWT